MKVCLSTEQTAPEPCFLNLMPLLFLAFGVIGFEARQGTMKTIVLLVASSAASITFGLSFALNQCPVEWVDVSVGFASLGLAHADMIVNWDLLTLGSFGRYSRKWWLFWPIIDLILFPLMMSLWNGKETILVCLGGYAFSFSFTLPFVPHMMSSKVLGPPNTFHCCLLRGARVLCSCIAVGSLALLIAWSLRQDIASRKPTS